MVPDERYHAKIKARMAEIDALPKPVRELVHEYGWHVVHAFLLCGVTKPNYIRHLITVSRESAASYSNGRAFEAGLAP